VHADIISASDQNFIILAMLTVIAH